MKAVPYDWIEKHKITVPIAQIETDDEVIYREVVFTDKGIPTTEAELMIYCKNCKHFEQIAEGWNRCYIYGTSVRPDDYCSTGERREDE